MSEKKDDRPARTSMEGMLWNANHVLDAALDPKTNGVPRWVFEYCKGIILISVVEAGFIFSGSVGTGVVLARKSDGSWSNPSAIGLGGVGFGLLFGAAIKDIMIVVNDESALETVTSRGQVQLGGELSLALGPVGRSLESNFQFSEKGVAVMLAYSFSKGLFGGIGLDGAILRPRPGENAKFYGKEATPVEIVLEGKVTVPEGNTSIAELQGKLKKLEAGETMELTDEDRKKKESAKVEADKVAESLKSEQPDVIEVDAEKEAAKESTTE